MTSNQEDRLPEGFKYVDRFTQIKLSGYRQSFSVSVIKNLPASRSIHESRYRYLELLLRGPSSLALLTSSCRCTSYSTPPFVYFQHQRMILHLKSDPLSFSHESSHHIHRALKSTVINCAIRLNGTLAPRKDPRLIPVYIVHSCRANEAPVQHPRAPPV